ncbi:adenylate/guanylate cyclase catalytic domain protein [mine drainage metagenome]|uniref:Adenylate/guanylate cyclase catalytic domain protein n=1 Tax=mine drainage metagenome TaxID=410659 RepID=T1BMZ3_9ZZZZ
MVLDNSLGIEELIHAGALRRELAQAHLHAEIRRREEVLRRAVRRYVSPQLAERILEDVQLRETLLSADDLRTHAVVLFADLRGFTSLSERLEPRQVVPLLNEYFSLLTEITLRHDGTVFHLAGDCLMLGFGVPLEQPDTPRPRRAPLRRCSARLRRSPAPGTPVSASMPASASASTRAMSSPATSARVPT